MAARSPQPTQPQTSLAQPAMVVPGQQTGYQIQPGQQPVQSHVAAPGQSAPTGHQTAAYWTTAPVNKPQRTPIVLTLEFAFLKTQAGVLKCIEFVTILIAFSCVMHYKELVILPDRTLLDEDSNLDFFVGSLVSAWVMVILVSFSFIIGLHKVGGAPHNFHIVVCVLHALWALLVVISSGLMAGQARDWMDAISATGVKFNKIRKEDKIRLIMLFVAVVFGFFSFISLVLNALLHFRFYAATKNQAPHVMHAHPGTQQPMMQGHPGIQQPMMQGHPGIQQPMMQAQPGVQQPLMQGHPGIQQL